ncbi:hypothetical protein Bca101_066623 [Brassica carinata]
MNLRRQGSINGKKLSNKNRLHRDPKRYQIYNSKKRNNRLQSIHQMSTIQHVNQSPLTIIRSLKESGRTRCKAVVNTNEECDMETEFGRSSPKKKVRMLKLKADCIPKIGMTLETEIRSDETATGTT